LRVQRYNFSFEHEALGFELYDLLRFKL